MILELWKNINTRIFIKALEQNKVIKEFDRHVFESIVEKMIVGGIDENGNKDLYKLTFVYKTGYNNTIKGSKDRFKSDRKNAKNVHDKLCSHNETDTCGDYCVATTSRYVEILYFKHFYKHIVFTGEGDKIRNKVIKDYINVSVVIDMECG